MWRTLQLPSCFETQLEKYLPQIFQLMDKAMQDDANLGSLVAACRAFLAFVFELAGLNTEHRKGFVQKLYPRLLNAGKVCCQRREFEKAEVILEKTIELADR